MANAAAPAVEEPAFPRGGRQTLTAIERKRLREEGKAQAEKDFYAGEKRRRKSTEGQEDDDLYFANKDSQGKLPKYAELLKYKKLGIGSKIWGAVSGILAKELQISLPDGLRGVVAISEASDVFSELLVKQAATPAAVGNVKGYLGIPSLHATFKVGQLVRATVLAIREKGEDGERQQVVLSLRVSKQNSSISASTLENDMVLPACVGSVEDHGYILSLGIKGVVAFLGKKDRNEGAGGSAPLIKGSLVEVVITDASDKRLIRVTTNPNTVPKKVTKEWQGLTIGSLLPGSLVDVTVRNVLSDGLLVSFLTYFTGTIDPFHIASNSALEEGWDSAFPVGTRLKARVLYVDSGSKKICLSLLPHLLKMQTVSLPPPSTLIKDAVVRRIDAKVGVLLHLPSHGSGYAHISNVSDEKVNNLAKALQPGQKESARVIGSRLMDGLAVVSLKASAVELSFAGGPEVGQKVKGKVVLTNDNGIVVELTRTLNAFVPNLHLSDLGVAQGRAKHRVGKEVVGRIIAVNPATQRLTMTLKNALVSSKAKPLAAWEDARVGLKVTGVVDGIHDYGIFVHFYGEMKGLVHVSELELAAGKTPADVYEVGQAIKVQILSVDSAKQRIQLSLRSKKNKTGGRQNPRLRPGSVVDGVVAALVDGTGEGAQLSYLVDLRDGEESIGSGALEAVHLSDHITAAAAFKEVIQVGSALGKVMVLECTKQVKLTRKASMLAAAETLPKSFEEVQLTSVLTGYVLNVFPDAVYVRFLNGVTGRAGLSQLGDKFVGNPEMVYTVGQSVRAKVYEVVDAKRQLSLTLKHSLVGSMPAAFLRSLFSDMEMVHQMSAAKEAAVGEPSTDWSKFSIGATVGATLHDCKSYGFLFDLDQDENLVGLVAKHQMEGKKEVGTRGEARVLNVAKKDGIIDLSRKSTLVTSGTKKVEGSSQQLPEIGETVAGEVELIRDQYMVVSLPNHQRALGFVGLQDLNRRNIDLSKRFSIKKIYQFVVDSHPCAGTGGRMILVEPASESAKSKSLVCIDHCRALRSKYRSGSLHTVSIFKAEPLRLTVQFPEGNFGRIHITEVTDEPPGDKNPLEKYKEGDSVEVSVLGTWAKKKFKKQNADVELSMRPSVISGAAKGKRLDKRVYFGNIKPGRKYTGFVSEITSDYLRVALSPTVSGQVFVLDASSNLSELSTFPKQFKIGQSITCRALKVDHNEHILDLSLLLEGAERLVSGVLPAEAKEGSVMMGKVASVQGSGVRIQLGRSLFGAARLLDLHDDWVENAVAGLDIGAFVRCCVLQNSFAEQPGVHEAPADRNASDAAASKLAEDSKSSPEAAGAGKRKLHGVAGEGGPRRRLLSLSLKQSKGGEFANRAAAAAVSEDAKAVTKAGVKQAKEACGYVVEAKAKGVTIAIAQGLEGRIRHSDLGNNPATTFALGQLVSGEIARVVAPNLVEIALPETMKHQTLVEKLKSLGLEVGQQVKGDIVRRCDFGIFVRLQCSDYVGLVHTSEAPKHLLDMPESDLHAHHAVTATVRRIDLKKGRLALSLKGASLQRNTGQEEPSETSQDIDEEMLQYQTTELGEELLSGAGQETDEDEGGASDGERGSPTTDLEDAVLSHPSRKRRKLSGEAAEQCSDAGSEEEQAFSSEYDSDEEGVESGANESEGGSKGSDGGSLEPSAEALQNHLQSKGVGWDEEQGDDQKMADASEGSEDVDKGPNKRQLKRQKQEHEARVRAAELARLQESAPQNAADFERELLGSPNSSLLWLRYMAFLLSLGEVEQGRALAERALKTINFREEGEKLNIWVGWLNLELKYGSPPEEAVTKLFQRALQFNDQKKLYLKFIDVLENAQMEELVAQTFKVMTRKFSGSGKVWLRHLASLQKADDAEGATKVLERALSATPARKHIKILRQAGLQEFKFGSSERGRSIFEGMLRTYPKHMDLWSVYIDQELKLGESARIRSLFERGTSLKLPAKKIKFLFKRYLEYEKRHGSAASVERVKQSAREYVDRHLG